MSATMVAANLSELKRLWEQWTGVVALFAQRRRRTRHRMSAEDYRRLHADLLRASRAHADASDEVLRIFFRQMETLAAPWVSVESLAHTHWEVVADLLVQCNETTRAVGWRSRKVVQQQKRRRLGGRMLVLGIVVGLALLLTTTDSSLAPLVYELKRLFHQARLAAARTDSLRTIAVAAVIMVGLGMWAVNTTRKS